MTGRRVRRPVLPSPAVSTRPAKTLAALVVAVVTSVGLTACGGGDTGGGDASIGAASDVAIQIDAQKITNGEIERRAMFLATNPTSNEPVTAPAKDSVDFKEFRLQAAEQLRDERVFNILAAQCGKPCAVADAEIKKQLDDIRDQQFAGSATEFAKALETRGITEADLRKSLKASQHEQRLTAREQAKVQYTDAEGMAYYKKNIAQYKLIAEKRISHILVATKAAAAAIRAEATPENFAELARTRSIDPSAKTRGGEDLGSVTAGGLLPELAAAAQTLKGGQISAPVQSQFGWHILLARQVTARTKPYVEVRDEIEAQEIQVKQAAAVQKWRDTTVKRQQDKAKYLNDKIAPEKPAASTTTAASTTAPTTSATSGTATTAPSGTTTGPATP